MQNETVINAACGTKRPSSRRDSEKWSTGSIAKGSCTDCSTLRYSLIVLYRCELSTVAVATSSAGPSAMARVSATRFHGAISICRRA
tara:strand:- start:2994 stop:3254 length:261 start_codon:yes stop_codon:yes gene_type:complete